MKKENSNVPLLYLTVLFKVLPWFGTTRQCFENVLRLVYLKGIIKQHFSFSLWTIHEFVFENWNAPRLNLAPYWSQWATESLPLETICGFSLQRLPITECTFTFPGIQRKDLGLPTTQKGRDWFALPISSLFLPPSEWPKVCLGWESLDGK